MQLVLRPVLTSGQSVGFGLVADEFPVLRYCLGWADGDPPMVLSRLRDAAGKKSVVLLSGTNPVSFNGELLATGSTLRRQDGTSVGVLQSLVDVAAIPALGSSTTAGWIVTGKLANGAHVIIQSNGTITSTGLAMGASPHVFVGPVRAIDVNASGDVAISARTILSGQRTEALFLNGSEVISTSATVPNQYGDPGQVFAIGLNGQLAISDPDWSQGGKINFLTMLGVQTIANPLTPFREVGV
jgi:hypothetical protein